MKRKTTLFIALFAVLQHSIQGQTIVTVDGTGTGNYTTISEAVSYVNSLETIPEGGVIVNIAAGQTFNEDLPIINYIGSSSSPLIFQKNGDGVNPLITYQDEFDDKLIVHIQNSAFVEWNSIDITDPNITDALTYQAAIAIEASSEVIITNSNISNFSRYGIYSNGVCTNNRYVSNILAYDNQYMTPRSTVYPIYANYNSASDSIIIDRNIVNGFHHADIVGIRVNRVRSFVTNNIIAINGEANTVQGLRLDGGPENRTISAYNNTVSISGIANEEGYSLFLTGADGTFDIRNNIFIINRISAAFEQANLFIGYATATAPVFNLSNNIYYNANNQGFIGAYINNSTISSLQEWQGIGNYDLSSKVLNVEFVDIENNDLHLSAAYAQNSLFAGDIVNLATDIDGEERGTIPYIGADELALFPFDYYNLSLSINNINYEEVALGFSSIETVSVLNNDATISVIDSIISPEGWFIQVDESEFVQSIYELYLPGNTSKDIVIKFEPTTMGVQSGIVSIYIGVQRFDILVSGIAISADIEISETEINVGSTPIEVPLIYEPYKVFNISDIEQTVNLLITGDYVLRLVGQETWNTEILDQIITPGDSLQIEIMFNPQTYNFHNDTLLVYTSQFTFLTKLTGRALGVLFDGVTQTPFLRMYNGSSVWGDFDGDGLQDLAMSGYKQVAYKGFMDIYKNLGNGNFQSVGQDFTGLGSSALAWIDVDNDGDLDLYASGQDTMNVRKTFIIENQNGTFVERIPENIPPMSGGSVSVADFNNDGFMDLLVTGEEYIADAENIAHTHIYLNNKNGDFNLMPSNLPQITSGHAVAADFNNDGLVDVAIAGRIASFQYISRLYRNEGNGVFAEVNLPEVIGLRYSKVRFGDYDADGFLDLLIVGSYNDDENSITYVYKNNGGESFTKFAQIGGVRLGDAQWADLDNNGTLDIILNGILNNATWIGRIYIFEPIKKVFTLVDTIVDMRASELSLCDYNSDNSVDFMLTGRYDYQDYRTILYRNKWHITNTPPTPPATVSVSPAYNLIYVEWSDGADNESNVTYNLRIGSEPGYNDLYNSCTLNDGTLTIPSIGNMGTKNSILLPWTRSGEFYVSVQSVDASFIGSEWSQQTSFVGFDNIDSNINFNVYPIPAQSHIVIKMFNKKPGSTKIEIFDMSGRICLTKIFETTSGLFSTQIDFEKQLKSGLYIIKASHNDEIYTTQFDLQ